MHRWSPLLLLAAAQFIMVLDSSVMNVAITQIVADLDTSIEGVQLAITMYTLVMASGMLVGAKLAEMWGARQTFLLGMAVYGCGSLITSISPNLPVLLLGWSLVEGLGAAMVLPSIAALAVLTYEGRARALAYGVLGGIAGAAIAVGPVIGGWVTTAASWRLVFVAEAVGIVVLLLFHGRMTRTRPDPRSHMDGVGALLSASGLALVVLGVLQSGTWGWIRPADVPTIAGHELAPLGFSPVPFMILGGLTLLWQLGRWLEARRAAGSAALFDPAVLQVPEMRAGLTTLVMQQLILLGTFFVLPVYLQVVLGLDAFETGVRLLPLSAALLVCALGGPRMAARRSVRTVVRIGIALLSAGALVLAGAVDVELDRWPFALGLFLSGAGAGLLVSQLGNVIMSSVGADKATDAGGLQGTAQNIGASLGTALVGSILLAGLTAGFVSNVNDNPSIPTDVRDQVVAAAETGIDMVSLEDARTAASDAGLADDQVDQLVDDYADAQLSALKASLLVVSIVALIAFYPARRLPASRVDELEAA